MIENFGVDPIGGRLALRCGSVSGEGWIRITEPTGETIGEIPPELYHLRINMMQWQNGFLGVSKAATLGWAEALASAANAAPA